MQKTMTRQMLYQLDQEMQSMKRESPALALLLNSQINAFYKKAGFQLNVMKSRFAEIQAKYIQKDEQGNFLTTETNGTRTWLFINSKIDLENAKVLDVSMVEQAFEKECTQFFSTSITFEL